MKENKRQHKRYEVYRNVTLISPSQKKITATISNVSLTGLLLCKPSAPIDESATYKIEILAANNQSIFLTGIAVWKDPQYTGIKITRYHFDSKEIFQSFIDDLKTTCELVGLLDDGWLDYLFEDERGNQVQIKYC